jgi:hypothetical protein
MGDHRVSRLPDTERAGEEDRCLQLSQLRDLGHAHQLAEPVPHLYCRRHPLVKEVAGMRNDGGDSCSHRISVAHRRLPHRHSRDVGNGIQRAGRKQSRSDAEVAGAMSLLGQRRGDDEKREREREEQRHSRCPKSALYP